MPLTFVGCGSPSYNFFSSSEVAFIFIIIPLVLCGSFVVRGLTRVRCLLGTLSLGYLGYQCLHPTQERSRIVIASVEIIILWDVGFLKSL